MGKSLHGSAKGATPAAAYIAFLGTEHNDKTLRGLANRNVKKIPFSQ